MTPSFANLLRLGVATVVSPNGGIYAPISSVTNQSIFGRSGSSKFDSTLDVSRSDSFLF